MVFKLAKYGLRTKKNPRNGYCFQDFKLSNDHFVHVEKNVRSLSKCQKSIATVTVIDDGFEY